MTRRKILTAGGMLIVILAGVAGLGSLLGRRTTARFPSSFAPEPEGLLAFRRLLGELEVPTSIGMEPWDRILDRSRAGLVMLALPLQREIDAEELEAMRAWLNRGGTLLVVDDATTLERSDALDGLLDRAGLAFRPPLPDLDRRTAMVARPVTRAARGAPAPPAGNDLRRLMLHRDGGLLPTSLGTPLAISAAREIVAAEGRLGSGRVLLVQGALLANDSLLEGDALAFALRIVQDAVGPPAADLRERDGNRVILIDEYHHGYGGVFPVRHLDAAALAWAAAQAIGVTLLYAGARGVRFRPARTGPAKTRRSSLEFVRSMASLYQRGGARAHALEVLRDRFERQARTLWDLPQSLTPRALAQACAARSSLDEARIASVLDAVEEAIHTPQLSESLMTRRAAQMENLEKEVLDGRHERS